MAFFPHDTPAPASTYDTRTLTSQTELAELAWEGDLDIASAPILAAALAVLCDRETTSIALDASNVTFLDCAGLTVLLRFDDRLLGRLFLLHPSPPVVRLLDVVKLTGRFPDHLPGDASGHDSVGHRRPRTPPRDPKVVMEQATGLLMGTYACTSGTALRRLRETSAGRNVRVRSLAGLLLALAPPPAGRRTSIPGTGSAAVVRRIMAGSERPVREEGPVLAAGTGGDQYRLTPW